MDQSKKTMRHFYCRDVLWETFEQMANDFDCSIDYLINEAMRYYARSKNYTSTAMPSSMHPHLAGPNNMNNHGLQPSNYGPSAYPPPNANNAVARRPQQPPPTPMTGGPAPTYRRPSANIPTASPRPEYRNPVNATPTLYLIYNGHRYPISKDQFIIGRGSKSSDLAIKDGNISRKHAAVIRRNGTYYIKDLGSTNGIDYKGMRIDNKRVDEGDVFHICDYELRFTYRPD